MESAGGYNTIDLVPHVIDCTRKLYAHTLDASPDQWIFVLNEVLYYLFPVLLTVGVIFSIINTVIAARMVSASHECYLTAFNLSSSLLLITVCLFQLPNYVREADAGEYTALLPYLPAVQSWFWYSCTWLLVTMVVERSAHSACGTWHSSFGRVHGSLVSILMMAVCFVCSLPQYWEYGLSQRHEIHGNHNCSRDVLTPRPSVLLPGGQEYVPLYTWYHWFDISVGVGLPYLLLPMAIIPLVCVKTHIYTSMPLSTAKKSGGQYASSPNIKEQLREERSFNRLLFTVTVLYLVLSAPLNLLRLVNDASISLTVSDNKLLMSTLYVLFNVIFHAFFSSLFFLYLSFGKKFRTTLYQLCCCKKYEDIYDYY